MTLPLADIRAIDLSRNIAGPLCTMLLGDLGADVIKVERPGSGDESRNHAAGKGVSPYFAALNRNKRSLTLDLKSSEGIDDLHALLASSDVLVDNFRPGALARLGLDDARLARDHPDLIVCHISGFGPTGPWADATAYDHIIQGFSGLMSLTGPEGVGGYRTNTSVADFVTGLFAAVSVIASLRGRDAAEAAGETVDAGQATAKRSPGGDIIDISLLGSLLNALCYQSSTYLTLGVAPTPLGNQHPFIVPYGTFDTLDGAVNICVGNNRLFQLLVTTLGHPEIATDARFGSNQDRVRNRNELNALIGPALKSRPTAEWVAELRGQGVPVGPVHTLPQALEHPQVEALGLIVDVDDGGGETVRQLGPPFRSRNLDGLVRRRSPLLGEHDGELRVELGLRSGAAGRTAS